MDILFTIRAIIFLTAGLILIIFPKKTFKASSNAVDYLAKKLHIKHRSSDTKSEERKGVKINIVFGICCLIISAVLFMVAID